MSEKDQPLAIGERWHVRLPRRRDLEEVQIEALTEKTVIVSWEAVLHEARKVRVTVRYERCKVKFVERVLT